MFKTNDKSCIWKVAKKVDLGPGCSKWARWKMLSFSLWSLSLLSVSLLSFRHYWSHYFHHHHYYLLWFQDGGERLRIVVMGDRKVFSKSSTWSPWHLMLCNDNISITMITTIVSLDILIITMIITIISINNCHHHHNHLELLWQGYSVNTAMMIILTLSV